MNSCEAERMKQATKTAAKRNFFGSQKVTKTHEKNMSPKIIIYYIRSLK